MPDTAFPAKRKILIVEDSMPLRRMLCKIVETVGLAPTEAADGAQALAALQREGPSDFSLILCDLMMPVMDGSEFIQQAREAHTALPPVLICSSRSDREAVEVVRKLGVAGYILKPFMTETVLRKIRDVLPDAARAAES